MINLFAFNKLPLGPIVEGYQYAMRGRHVKKREDYGCCGDFEILTIPEAINAINKNIDDLVIFRNKIFGSITSETLPNESPSEREADVKPM